MNFNQLLETYGVAGFVIILASLAFYRITISIAKGMSVKDTAKAAQMNSDTKQEDMFTNLLTEINAERKASQERERAQQISINHLSAELMDVKLVQATETGRNTEIKETMQRERDEWKVERAETAENIRTLQTEVLELQKNQRDNQAKIKEHEALIETLNQRIASQDGEIGTLNATIAQLQAEKLQLLEQNTELGKQVVYHSSRVDNLSQLVYAPKQPDTPSPATPIPQAVTMDNTQAIPEISKLWDEDAEQTFITPPTPLPDSNDNELKSA